MPTSPPEHAVLFSEHPEDVWAAYVEETDPALLLKLRAASIELATAAGHALASIDDALTPDDVAALAGLTSAGMLALIDAGTEREDGREPTPEDRADASGTATALILGALLRVAGELEQARARLN